MVREVNRQSLEGQRAAANIEQTDSGTSAMIAKNQEKLSRTKVDSAKAMVSSVRAEISQIDKEIADPPMKPQSSGSGKNKKVKMVVDVEALNKLKKQRKDLLAKLQRAQTNVLRAKGDIVDAQGKKIEASGRETAAKDIQNSINSELSRIYNTFKTNPEEGDQASGDKLNTGLDRNDASFDGVDDIQQALANSNDDNRQDNLADAIRENISERLANNDTDSSDNNRQSGGANNDRA